MDKSTDNNLITINPDILNIIDRRDLLNEEYDVLVQMGIETSEVKMYAQWILGKLGDTIAVKHGDIKKYADEISQNYDVLRQYMNTYRKFIKEDPNFSPLKYAGSVPWGLLQLAATKSDTPQALVDDLHDKGAKTIPHAYREIKTMETGQQIPKKPKIGLQWDTEALKYKIKLKTEELDLIDWSDVKDQLKVYLEALK